MTTSKHFKRRVRARAAVTGEPYATALRNLAVQKEQPVAPSSAVDVIASCSFCGKSSAAVQRLVAGPGVYICDGCVALSAWVIDEAGRAPGGPSVPSPSPEDRTTEQILPMLPALVDTADRIESELAAWVGRLRSRGLDWESIAGAAGLSVDDARRRFGDGVTPEPAPTR